MSNRNTRRSHVRSSRRPYYALLVLAMSVMYGHGSLAQQTTLVPGLGSIDPGTIGSLDHNEFV
ncbi:MAG TPA: hypothetical protein VG106_12430, partial [Vicinamibacterales bacterium]|nr:hypothetical protein [Vicinamibacterales bacterium]